MIIIVAAVLALAGLPAAGVVVLMAEALALGAGFVVKLRGAPHGEPGCAEI